MILALTTSRSPWTVMTYNETNKKGNIIQNMLHMVILNNIGAFDVAAIQCLYGANKNKNKGNNIYKLNNKLNGYKCIWDTGGIDVIDASSASGSSTINLKNATLEKEAGVEASYHKSTANLRVILLLIKPKIKI